MSSNPFRRVRRPASAVPGAQVAPHQSVAKEAPMRAVADRPQGAPTPQDPLTKVVQGQPATDLEERFARAVGKHPRVRQYFFNPRLVAGRILPADVSLSYAVYAPQLYPVQVDATFPNDTGEQRAQAAVNDALLMTWLQQNSAGAMPIARLSRLELATQAGADKAALGLF